MKIVVLDGYVNNPGDLSWEPLQRLGDCTIYDRTSPSDFFAHCGDAEIILTNKIPFSRSDIEKLPNLRYIGVIATGFNIIDVKAADDHGITVTNVPAYSTASVAQLAIAHLLNMTMQVDHYTRDARSGKWSDCGDFCYVDRPLIELYDKTIGIVGFGNIGSTVARIAQALGMRVLVYTSKSEDQLPPGMRKASSLDALFSESDVVSLHCPLTDETHGMVDTRRLSLMKRSARLINTSRGALVVESDLAEALRNGQIAGAALDVMWPEPPLKSNPLLHVPNCWFTPHLGWATFEARDRLMVVLTDNVKAYLAGEPKNVVNNP